MHWWLPEISIGEKILRSLIVLKEDTPRVAEPPKDSAARPPETPS